MFTNASRFQAIHANCSQLIFYNRTASHGQVLAFSQSSIQQDGIEFISIPIPSVSWYDLPSFLSRLFPPLSVPRPISITFWPHPTLSACLPPPPLQLWGVLVQLCYIPTWTSLRLTLDLLRPDSHAKGYCLHTSYNLSDPFFIINNG